MAVFNNSPKFLKIEQPALKSACGQLQHTPVTGPSVR